MGGLKAAICQGLGFGLDFRCAPDFNKFPMAPSVGTYLLQRDLNDRCLQVVHSEVIVGL